MFSMYPNRNLMFLAGGPQALHQGMIADLAKAYFVAEAASAILSVLLRPERVPPCGRVPDVTVMMVSDQCMYM